MMAGWKQTLLGGGTMMMPSTHLDYGKDIFFLVKTGKIGDF